MWRAGGRVGRRRQAKLRELGSTDSTSSKRQVQGKGWGKAGYAKTARHGTAGSTLAYDGVTRAAARYVPFGPGARGNTAPNDDPSMRGGTLR
ncbi:hypothetical protein BGLA2_860055 [Burkholderia gladioli]|nr:hypothetical protein BGLA2_860055 [Burkholderia gladioli]